MAGTHRRGSRCNGASVRRFSPVYLRRRFGCVATQPSAGSWIKRLATFAISRDRHDHPVRTIISLQCKICGTRVGAIALHASAMQGVMSPSSEEQVSLNRRVRLEASLARVGSGLSVVNAQHQRGARFSQDVGR